MKDGNHDTLSETAGKTGFQTLNLSEVPRKFPHLKGIPDEIWTQQDGLTIIGTFNQQQVLDALVRIPGVKVVVGAVILAEYKDPKTPHGLTEDQVIFHAKHPVHVFETPDEILELRPDD
ncbi:hypothetical protein ACFLXQ_09055 [Chloroflexota bacterium]